MWVLEMRDEANQCWVRLGLYASRFEAEEELAHWRGTGHADEIRIRKAF